VKDVVEVKEGVTNAASAHAPLPLPSHATPLPPSLLSSSMGDGGVRVRRERPFPGRVKLGVLIRHGERRCGRGVEDKCSGRDGCSKQRSRNRWKVGLERIGRCERRRGRLMSDAIQKRTRDVEEQ
jgi:hypothetical protein